jgi:hypothetical protein
MTQPGDTYYFSPKNVYIFGIAGNSIKPTTMIAYIYQEETSRKGMDNVASLIYCCLDKEKLLKENEPGASLTILCNNCSGQNKNNNVLRLPLWLVERGHFKEVSVLFFILGHTKNACDRMFNIMKKKYHKSNTFTFSQMKERLVVEGQVKIVDATREHFHAWGKALNTFYKKFPRGHIFTNNTSAATRQHLQHSG